MSTYPIELTDAGARTLMWANPDDVEEQALGQIRNVANLPWVEGVAIMPDVHYGYGATVGSVIAMKQAVSPSAVGVDIGCGMAAVKTSLTLEDLPDDLGPLRAAIEAAVPVGFHSHEVGSTPILKHEPKLGERFRSMGHSFGSLRAPGIGDRFVRALAQCGTLGGGNHFIELCSDETGAIWITLHSGSRNIGKELADRHIAKAKGLEHNSILEGESRDLAVFLSGTKEVDDYLHDLYWAQDYALLNRHIMLATVQRVIDKHFEGAYFGFHETGVTFDEPIQCHHNYVSEETYDGVDLIITRKGAIRAGVGDYGLIPGSMGTGSYVVEGLGNTQSYNSASHGAGRKMSRNKAKKHFTIEDLASQTSGVECRKDAGVLDEIPGAYKSIDSVMEAQSNLVKPIHRLTTLLCVKG